METTQGGGGASEMQKADPSLALDDAIGVKASPEDEALWRLNRTPEAARRCDELQLTILALKAEWLVIAARPALMRPGRFAAVTEGIFPSPVNLPTASECGFSWRKSTRSSHVCSTASEEML
jgi:hypothetical protein